MSEQCRYFDATGGCDLLFSQTAKIERLTFTGNHITQRGRRRWPMREIIEVSFYMLRSRCPWRLLPDSFPPWRARGKNLLGHAHCCRQRHVDRSNQAVSVRPEFRGPPIVYWQERG